MYASEKHSKTMYYFNVFFMHTFERKTYKMPDEMEYTSKLTEIWLIDEGIKDQSIKLNSYDKSTVRCYARYMVWAGLG